MQELFHDELDSRLAAELVLGNADVGLSRPVSSTALAAAWHCTLLHFQFSDQIRFVFADDLMLEPPGPLDSSCSNGRRSCHALRRVSSLD